MTRYRRKSKAAPVEEVQVTEPVVESVPEPEVAAPTPPPPAPVKPEPVKPKPVKAQPKTVLGQYGKGGVFRSIGGGQRVKL